jgi:hypothetical protein
LASMLRSLMVAIMTKKQKIIFRLDNGAHLSDLSFSPCPWSKVKVIIQGISGQSLECKFTWPLACSWGDLLFCHSFLIVPKTPLSLLGWNLLSQLKTQILLPPGSYLCCPLLQKQIDSTMWTDEMSVGLTWMALPI